MILHHLPQSFWGPRQPQTPVLIGTSVISPPPVKPEGTIGLHSVRQSVCQSVCLSVTLVFRTFLRYTFTYLDESWYRASIWRATDQVRLLSRLTYFFMSYCPLFKIRFPDFSRLCFHIPEWQFVESFHMKSYRASSTFVTADPLFPFVQNLFSGMVADLNLLGSVGDLYCFCNTLSMLVSAFFDTLQNHVCINHVTHYRFKQHLRGRVENDVLPAFESLLVSVFLGLQSTECLKTVESVRLSHKNYFVEPEL